MRTNLQFQNKRQTSLDCFTVPLGSHIVWLGRAKHPKDAEPGVIEKIGTTTPGSTTGDI